jgi:hypothetical protein
MLEQQTKGKLDGHQIAAIVQRIPPGCSIRFGLDQLNLPQPESGVGFGDLVLGGIAESAYEWFYFDLAYIHTIARSDWGYIFHRLPQPYPKESGLFASVPVARLSFYEGFPGRYRLPGQSAWYDQSMVAIEDRIYYSIEAIERDFSEGLEVYSQIEIPVFSRSASEPMMIDNTTCVDVPTIKSYTIYEFLSLRKDLNYYKLVPTH